MVALDTALHFLRACNVVDINFINDRLSPAAKEPELAEMWDVTDGITALTDDFQFCEEYVGMEIIESEGTKIAQDGDLDIKTPYDNCLLMMPNHRPGAGVRKLRLCRRS